MQKYNENIKKGLNMDNQNENKIHHRKVHIGDVLGPIMFIIVAAVTMFFIGKFV